MACYELHVGDSGTLLKVRVRNCSNKIVDLSVATTKELILESPGGTKKTKAANFVTDGTDGLLSILTLATDFDEDGDWQVQVHVVETGGADWMSSIGILSVKPNL